MMKVEESEQLNGIMIMPFSFLKELSGENISRNIKTNHLPFYRLGQNHLDVFMVVVVGNFLRN